MNYFGNPVLASFILEELIDQCLLDGIILDSSLEDAKQEAIRLLTIAKDEPDPMKRAALARSAVHIIAASTNFAAAMDAGVVAYAKIDALPSGVPMREVIDAAKAYAIDHYAGKTVVNEIDGSEILISKSGIEHALSGRAGRIDAMAATDLESLISKAMPIRYQLDKRTDRVNIEGIWTYGGLMRIADVDVPIGIIVRVHTDGKRYYDHFELKMKIPTSTSGDPSPSEEGQVSIRPIVGTEGSLDAVVLNVNEDSAALQGRTMNIFDSISDPLQRAQLSAALGASVKALAQAKGAGNALDTVKASQKVAEILAQLTGSDVSPIGEVSATPDDDLSDDPNASNYRYADTGYIADSRKEKAKDTIYTARKTGQRLRATDIDFDAIEQNPRQAKELVTKGNLFGKTDWTALQESGMEPGAGFLIDKIYSSIAIEPSEDRPQARKDYAIGLESIRDRLQDKKTAQEVVDVVDEIRDELNGAQLNPEEAERYELLREQMGEVGPEIRKWRDAGNDLYQQAQAARSDASRAEYDITKRKNRGWKVEDKHLQEAAQAKAHADALWEEWSTAIIDAKPKAEAAEKQYRALSQEANDIVRAAKARNLIENQVTRSWLTFGERFLKLVHYRSFRGKGSESFAGHVTNAKAGRIKDWSWADRERPTKPKDATEQQINFQLRVADTFERKGGKAVAVNSTQALKDMCGFRDVQSGNWVLKDPNSAKFHVEQMGMAISDMADMIGIEPHAIGLGGRIGMAFGARGTGGKNAARAHWEPILRVVNITKMGGGGCVGHELFHGMDNLLHELVNEKAAAKKDDFVTLTPELLPPGPIQDAVKGLRAAMLTGDRRTSEMIDFTDKDISTARYNIENPRGAIGRLINGAGSAEAAVLAVEGYFKGLNVKPKQVKDWRKLAAAYYAQPGETKATLNTGPAMSNFSAEAVILDSGSRNKYWSGAEEMAARAFQAWLEDRMASMDRRNDYLSVYADNKYHVDPLFGIEWKPYPEGDERTRINAAFDVLFDAIRKEQVFEKAAANKPLMDAIFGAESADVGAAEGLMQPLETCQ